MLFNLHHACASSICYVSDITASIKVETSREECTLARSHARTSSLDDMIKYLQSESKRERERKSGKKRKVRSARRDSLRFSSPFPLVRKRNLVSSSCSPIIII